VKRLVKDAEVFASGGEKVGLLDRVVIDPTNMEVSHIVVKKGFLFNSSKVIPISFVDWGQEGINLKKDAEELDKLPEFTDSSFVGVDPPYKSEQFVNSVFWYPTANIAWWQSDFLSWYPTQNNLFDMWKVIPEGKVALEEGAAVISKDGVNIGKVERVVVDPEGNHATHIVVSRGLINKENKQIPAYWIENITEEKVHLAIASNIFERLPEHDPVS